MTSPASLQAPRAVVMIRPHAFRVNPQTAADNAFQSLVAATESDLATAAFEEVSAAADRLQAEGVRVHLFDDDGRHDTPDSVFPNNWFSTHTGGQVAVYPMATLSRRRERRADVIELLKTEYRVQDVIDYSGLAHDGVYLEGTGAMVLDHIGRIAYTARSNRADPVALERFCTHFNFEPMVFDSADRQGRPVYHTNVLMCLATSFALVGLDLMTDPLRRAEVCQRLEDSGREVIALSPTQIAEFAANAIELSSPAGRLLALSTRAAAALTPAQRTAIERSARLVALPVPTIEQAGGSVRCMIAGIHLSARDASYGCRRMPNAPHIGGLASEQWMMDLKAMSPASVGESTSRETKRASVLDRPEQSKEFIMDLKEAIKAHSEWKMKLRAAIASQSALDAETIAKDNCCVLGKWLHGESKAKFGSLKSHGECVRLHAVFHKEAGKVAAAINGKRYVEAEQMLGAGTPYAGASNAVVIAIGSLQREAKL